MTTTTTPPPHHCSCNWTESSKAMEPNGIVDCAKQIWENGDWMKKLSAMTTLAQGVHCIILS